MHKILKLTTIAFIVLSLLVVPFGAMAADSLNKKQESSGTMMAADAVLLRPLGLVSTIGGFALFIVSSPFSAMGGNTGEAWDAMVKKPAKYTFTRPLGDF